MQQDEDNKPCPVCAETIKRAARKCRFCGTDIEVLKAAQVMESERLLFRGHPAPIYSTWQWISVIFTLGLSYLYYKSKSIATTYEITTQRIRVEHGVFMKVKHSIEVFEIDDFSIATPLGMRLEGYCILQLSPLSSRHPVIILYGIEGLSDLADTLRECAFRERIRRQVQSYIQP